MSGKTHFARDDGYEMVFDGIDDQVAVEIEAPICGCSPDYPTYSDTPTCKNCLRMLEPPKKVDTDAGNG